MHVAAGWFWGAFQPHWAAVIPVRRDVQGSQTNHSCGWGGHLTPDGWWNF